MISFVTPGLKDTKNTVTYSVTKSSLWPYCVPETVQSTEVTPWEGPVYAETVMSPTQWYLLPAVIPPFANCFSLSSVFTKVAGNSSGLPQHEQDTKLDLLAQLRFGIIKAIQLGKKRSREKTAGKKKKKTVLDLALLCSLATWNLPQCPELPQEILQVLCTSSGRLLGPWDLHFRGFNAFIFSFFLYNRANPSFPTLFYSVLDHLTIFSPHRLK